MDDKKLKDSGVELSDEALDAASGGGVGGNPQREAIPPKTVQPQTVTVPQRTTFPTFPTIPPKGTPGSN